MKEYFYTNPLKAFFNAQQHGIAVAASPDDPARYVVLADPAVFIARDGDQVKTGGNRIRLFCTEGFTPAEAEALRATVTEIVMRDGEHFFWPQVADVPDQVQQDE